MCDHWLKRFDEDIRIYSIDNSQCNVRRIVESDLLVGESDSAYVIPLCKDIPQCYYARRGGFFDMHDYRVRHSVIRTITPSHNIKPAHAPATISRTGWSPRLKPRSPPDCASPSRSHLRVETNFPFTARYQRLRPEPVREPLLPRKVYAAVEGHVSEARVKSATVALCLAVQEFNSFFHRV